MMASMPDVSMYLGLTERKTVYYSISGSIRITLNEEVKPYYCNNNKQFARCVLFPLAIRL
jgi:hypothetical protein